MPDHLPSTDERASLAQPSQSSSPLECTSHLGFSLGLDTERQRLAFRSLNRLHQAICVEPVVAYYEEKSQDIERVLNIFIRCNSGGTPLSYSNLLLSNLRLSGGWVADGAVRPGVEWLAAGPRRG